MLSGGIDCMVYRLPTLLGKYLYTSHIIFHSADIPVLIYKL